MGWPFLGTEALDGTRFGLEALGMETSMLSLVKSEGLGEEAGGRGDCFVDLYWIPVAAGTFSRTRQWSLACWEAAAAFLSRRPRATLYHPALKIGIEGSTHTMELTPVFIGEPIPPAMTGAVGFGFAGRFRIFRYQLRCLEVDALPDEEWAVMSPIALSSDCAITHRVLELASTVPAHVWGRRVRGTTEMWTSASAIAWILMRAGIDARQIPLPPGGRAPGWRAGLEAARREPTIARAAGG